MPTEPNSLANSAHVAIVGGGLCGCSTVYFLRQLMGDNLSVTLFEKSGRIGGRARAVKVGDELFETGASMFISSNQYMTSFAKQCGAPLIDHSTGATSSIALYAGHKKMAFTTVQGPSFLNNLRFVWRYGFDYLKLTLNTRKLTRDFSKIYELQGDGKCFRTPAALLTALSPDFLRMTGVTFGSWLRDIVGVSRRFADEVAYGFVANCYCQNLDVHAFVGMVASAGSNFTPLSVMGGNELIARHLLSASSGTNSSSDLPKTFVSAEVKMIAPGKRKRFRLDYEGEGGKGSSEFDFVVLALPLSQESTLCSPPTLRLPCFEYRVMNNIKLSGQIVPENLGLPTDVSPKKLANLFILPTHGGYEEDSGTLFKSFMHQRSVGSSECSSSGCWSVFTVPERLADPVTLLTLPYLRSATLLLSTRWLAFPVYSPLKNPNLDLGEFCIAPGLIYANALERAASCMELAIISGRNAALLVKSECDGKVAVTPK